MNTPDPKTLWETYCATELAMLRPILAKHGYTTR